MIQNPNTALLWEHTPQLSKLPPSPQRFSSNEIEIHIQELTFDKKVQRIEKKTR